jgi:hypothetical protein
VTGLPGNRRSVRQNSGMLLREKEAVPQDGLLLSESARSRWVLRAARGQFTDLRIYARMKFLGRGIYRAESAGEEGSDAALRPGETCCPRRRAAVQRFPAIPRPAGISEKVLSAAGHAQRFRKMETSE